MKIELDYPAPIDPISQKFAKTSDDIPLKYVTYESREKNCFDVKQQKNEKNKSIKKQKNQIFPPHPLYLSCENLARPPLKCPTFTIDPRLGILHSPPNKGKIFYSTFTYIFSKTTQITLHRLNLSLCTQTFNHPFEAKHPLSELFSTSRRS